MYVLDRLLALQLGRPIAIHEHDFDVNMPSRLEALVLHVENGTKSPQPNNIESRAELPQDHEPSSMDYFIGVIRFSQILGQVIREIYQPSQAEASPDGMLYSTSSLDNALLEWKNNLVRHLRFDLGHTFEKSITYKRQVSGPTDVL